MVGKEQVHSHVGKIIQTISKEWDFEEINNMWKEENVPLFVWRIGLCSV